MTLELDECERHLLIMVLAVAVNSRPWFDTFARHTARKLEAEQMFSDCKASVRSIQEDREHRRTGEAGAP